jgi:hypothetical protein
LIEIQFWISSAVGFGVKKKDIDVITVEEVNGLIEPVNDSAFSNSVPHETENLSTEEYELLMQQNENNMKWWAQEVVYNGKKMSRRVALGFLQRLYYFEQQRQGRNIADLPHTVHCGQRICTAVLEQLKQLPVADVIE